MLFIDATQNEGLVGEGKEGEFKLKEWECVRVESHSDVGKTIEKLQKMGWRLKTYRPIHIGKGTDVDHFLLFEKGK